MWINHWLEQLPVKSCWLMEGKNFSLKGRGEGVTRRACKLWDSALICLFFLFNNLFGFGVGEWAATYEHPDAVLTLKCIAQTQFAWSR